MRKFVFVLTRGLEDPTRVTRAFQMAKAAKENNFDVSMFLTDDAAIILKTGVIDNVKAPTGDEAGVFYKFLLEKKVPIFV